MTTDDTDHLRALLADEHAKRCAAELDHAGAVALLAEQTARAEKAEAERDAARASEASIRASAIRHDDANNETIRVLTKKHDAALAANAEMRAALEDALTNYEAGGGVPMGPLLDLARSNRTLSRTDLDAGMVVVPREAVERALCALLETPAGSRTRNARIEAGRVLRGALLKKGGG